MFWRYSRWIGETLRRVENDRSSGAAGAGVEHGLQRHRGVVDVGDQPGPVDRVEAARLGGDVRGRVVQPQERVQVRATLLGDDLAVPVAVEAVDHHPVEAGHLADLAGQLLGQVGHRRLGGEPAHRRARGLVAEQHRARPPQGLDLDHEPGAGPVQAHVHLDAGQGAFQRLGQVRDQGLVERALGCAPPDLGRQVRAEHVAEAGAVGPVRGDPQQLVAVGGGDGDREAVRVHGEKYAVRLDGPGHVDRFSLAVGEVDRPVGGRVPCMRWCRHDPPVSSRRTAGPTSQPMAGAEQCAHLSG